MRGRTEICRDRTGNSVELCAVAREIDTFGAWIAAAQLRKGSAAERRTDCGSDQAGDAESACGVAHFGEGGHGGFTGGGAYFPLSLRLEQS